LRATSCAEQKPPLACDHWVRLVSPISIRLCRVGMISGQS
jgi:hypothetical protein